MSFFFLLLTQCTVRDFCRCPFPVSFHLLPYFINSHAIIFKLTHMRSQSHTLIHCFLLSSPLKYTVLSLSFYPPFLFCSHCLQGELTKGFCSFYGCWTFTNKKKIKETVLLKAPAKDEMKCSPNCTTKQIVSQCSIAICTLFKVGNKHIFSIFNHMPVR